jgi:hypothetical protein
MHNFFGTDLAIAFVRVEMRAWHFTGEGATASLETLERGTFTYRHGRVDRLLPGVLVKTRVESRANDCNFRGYLQSLQGNAG